MKFRVWGCRMSLMARTFGLVLVLVAAGCGGGSSRSPTAPTPIPEPTPAPTVANIAGAWTGRLEYKFDGQPYGINVTLTVSQSGTAVTGAWSSSVDWSGELAGELSGFGVATTLAGTMTFSTTSSVAGVKCNGRGSVAGPAAPPSMRWAVARATADNCTGELVDAVFTLSRS